MKPPRIVRVRVHLRAGTVDLTLTSWVRPRQIAAAIATRVKQRYPEAYAIDFLGMEPTP